jgi:hypothetical protein
MEGLSDTTTLADVFDRCRRSCGGADAFASLETRVVRCRIVTDLQWDTHIQEVDTLVIYAKAPDSYRVVHSPGGFIEGHTHGATWKTAPDGAVTVDASGGWYEPWLTDIRFFARLEEHYPDAELLGVDLLEGEPFYVVAVDERPIHNIYFGIEDGRPARLGFHTTLHDFTPIDGVLLPKRVVHGRKGGSSTFVVDAIRHGVPLADTLFAVPLRETGGGRGID